MAFVAAAGGVLVWRIAHDNYSDDYYSDHSRHSNHSQYGDSQLRNEISNAENRVNNKEAEIQNLRQRMHDNYNSQISSLKQEKNYSALNGNVYDILANVKSEMKRELETEVQSNQRELEEINKMIAKINELELQARGVLDKDGYDKNGFDVNGFNKEGFDKDGFDVNRFNKDGFNKNGTRYDDSGYDKEGFNKEGYDQNGFNKKGFKRTGFHRNGTRYDDEGYDCNGYDKDGYDRNGLDKYGNGD